MRKTKMLLIAAIFIFATGFIVSAEDQYVFRGCECYTETYNEETGLYDVSFCIVANQAGYFLKLQDPSTLETWWISLDDTMISECEMPCHTYKASLDWDYDPLSHLDWGIYLCVPINPPKIGDRTNFPNCED
jgi:hypothetical protein